MTSQPTSPPPLFNEWSNEKILKFIDLLSSEPAIWNPKNKQHKLKHKVHDAWVRIGEVMCVPIEDLKAKKKSLMASFRPLVHKKKSSIRSGSSADEIYQPTWFAYNAMESFLGSIYDVNETINTEILVDSLQNEYIENDNKVTQDENIDNEITQNVNTLNRMATHKNKKCRQDFDVEDAQRKLNTSFQTLNNILIKNKTEEDECDIYGKLLATKLRKYPESIRQRIMYKIDGLLLENPPCTAYFGSRSSTSSTDHTIPPSPTYIISQSPGHTIAPCPSYLIPQSSEHTILPSPVTICIPEDDEYSEAPLNLMESGPQKKINILSQEITVPTTKNSRNIINTAFFNPNNHNAI